MPATKTALWEAVGLDGYAYALYRNGKPVCKGVNFNNAKFIVRACNAHDEMLSALQLVAYHVNDERFTDRHGLGQVVNAAIAKATGGAA